MTTAWFVWLTMNRSKSKEKMNSFSQFIARCQISPSLNAAKPSTIPMEISTFMEIVDQTQFVPLAQEQASAL